MTVLSTTPDTEARTLTVVAEFAAPPARVWQLWSDPRQLERWWGPPTWPATFVEHDLVPGGSARYVMTGPEGEQAREQLAQFLTGLDAQATKFVESRERMRARMAARGETPVQVG